ncbi:YjjG family noncanonical pyrimidine nucleotidase [Carnobacteriaceae bacterium zg-C25]|nr:YjjG family noncanonical pyrimidine nucleotidase [Carnobacteriaceae bacterium zg-C25]
MHYKFLLFDIDDTLLDFGVAQKNAFQLFLADYGIVFTDAIYEAYHVYNQALWHQYEKREIEKAQLLAVRFPNFLKRFDVRIDDGLEADNRYRSYLSQGNQLIDGALELVQNVASQYTIAVVTNGVSHTQRTRLVNNGLSEYFSRIYISDEIGAQKPDAQFFDAVKSSLGVVNPSDVLIIGDSLTADIFGGQQAGFDTCWVNKENKEMTLEHPPTMIISTIKELMGKL